MDRMLTAEPVLWPLLALDVHTDWRVSLAADGVEDLITVASDFSVRLDPLPRHERVRLVASAADHARGVVGTSWKLSSNVPSAPWRDAYLVAVTAGMAWRLAVSEALPGLLGERRSEWWSRPWRTSRWVAAAYAWPKRDPSATEADRELRYLLRQDWARENFSSRAKPRWARCWVDGRVSTLWIGTRDGRARLMLNDGVVSWRELCSTMALDNTTSYVNTDRFAVPDIEQFAPLDS